MTHTITIPGTFISVFGVGILLTGKPGIGKSSLALGLIDRKHRFIADDASTFYYENGQIQGRGELDKAFLTIRSIGLIDVTEMFGCISVQEDHPLQLILHLKEEYEENTTPILDIEFSTKDVLGCLIPYVTIPIINPRNLEVLVETIVKKYLLKVNNSPTPLSNFEDMLLKKMESDLS